MYSSCEFGAEKKPSFMIVRGESDAERDIWVASTDFLCLSSVKEE